jgi:hypothetical protein
VCPRGTPLDDARFQDELIAELGRGDVDPERVHELLRTRLGDFDRFAVAITEYLRPHGQRA